MSVWPELKTARDLVVENILPCSEDYIRALAKAHGVGRKLGRQYVFEPADVRALIEKLPCPSSSSKAATEAPAGTSAGPSAESAWTKALAATKRKRPKRSASKERRNSSPDQSTVTPLFGNSRKP